MSYTSAGTRRGSGRVFSAEQIVLMTLGDLVELLRGVS